jgi:ribosomal protein S18 acetylase RimI-like enzyme
METTPQTEPLWLNQVRVRRMESGDLPGLEWDGEFTHYRRIYADAFSRMQAGLAVHWVAELPGVGIIGQVFIQLICDRPELADGFDRAYLYSFRIKSQYRGQGIGTRVLNTVATDLRRRHFRILTLNVAKENLAARRLYEREGFRVVAHEPGIWSYTDHEGILHHVEEPAWRMERKL